MIEVSIKIKNIEEVRRDFKNLGINLRKAIANTLKEAAEVVKGEAISLVRMRSGKTRRSIESAVDIRGAMTAYVGTDWFVGRFLEQGTKKMRAYPFLRPAVEKSENRIRMALVDNLNEAVIKTGRQ